MDDSAVITKVLLVDDEAINIKLLSEALEGQCELLFATSGRRALMVAATQQPDLILLDIKMPEMDGYEVCRALKADNLLRNIPVIFITALDSEADESVGLRLGAVDYIAKPFNPDLIRLRVKNHLEMKRQRDLLSRLSLMDSLTELPNRRAFDERLALEWRRAIRSHSALSVIMIDIDHFKGYNDIYGHLAGDGCLRRVARALAQHSNRASDFLSRYGGEEFVCLLSGTDAGEALLIAERLRTGIENLEIAHPASPGFSRVTISIGSSSGYPSLASTPESLLDAADRQLYRAKSEGRNRVCAEEITVTPGTS